jgi:hypothetical protein
MPEVPVSPPDSRAAVSVLLSVNDLEALEIWRLLDQGVAEGVVHRVNLAHPWGGRPQLDDGQIASLASRVLLVEITDTALIDRIERAGRAVEVIGHHLTAAPDESPIDRRSPFSCLERMADRLGSPSSGLSLRQRLVAAGDRGFIPAMARVPGATPDLIQALREEDLTLARLAQDPGPHLAPTTTFNPAAPAWKGDLDRTRALIAEAQDYLQAKETQGWIHRLDSRVGASTDTRQPLLVARLPMRFRAVAMDAAYRWLAPDPGDVLEILLILGDDPASGAPFDRPGPSRRLEWSGPGHRAAQVPHWVEGEALARAPRLTRYAGGSETLFFGAEDPSGTAPEQVEDLANLILEDIVGGARPLRQWRTTFSQPLFLGAALSPSGRAPSPPPLTARILSHLSKLGATAAPPWVVVPEEAERRYFTPQARDLLVSPLAPVPDGDDGATWRAAQAHVVEGDRLVAFALPVAGYALRLTLPGALAGAESALTLPLEDLRLTFFPGDVLVVEWTVARASPQQPAWGRNLLEVLEGPGEDQVATLAEAVAFNAETRLLSSSWVDGEGARRGTLPVITLLKGGAELGRLERNREISPSPITGWFAALVTAATGLGPEDFEDARGDILSNAGRLRCLADDRARVVTTLLIHGQGPSSPPGRQAMEDLMARVAQVDSHGVGPAYDAAFTRAEFQAARYDRYLDMGTVYAATSHALALVAQANPISVGLLAPHMNTLYRRLFLITQASLGALGGLSLMVAEAWERSRRGEGGDWALAAWFADLTEALPRITRHPGFSRVTTQIQGVEMFALMTGQAALEQTRQEVAAEIARLADWLTARDAVARNGGA